MKNMLAKDMFIQGESLAKFYLKLACTVVWESIAQLITYMMGINMEKLCLYVATPCYFFIKGYGLQFMFKWHLRCYGLSKKPNDMAYLVLRFGSHRMYDIVLFMRRRPCRHSTHDVVFALHTGYWSLTNFYNQCLPDLSPSYVCAHWLILYVLKPW